MDKKINPDINAQLPRESHNIANDMGPIPEKIGQKVNIGKPKPKPS